MQIRVADRNDHRWIVSRHGAVYAEEFGFDGDFEASIDRKLSDFLDGASSFSRIWIGSFKGKRAASLAISARSGRTAFLNFLLVLPEFRGRGAARILMETAIAHARLGRMSEVRLETYSCLAGARALYGSFGFELAETSPGVEAFGRTFDREFWVLPLSVAPDAL